MPFLQRVLGMQAQSAKKTVSHLQPGHFGHCKTRQLYLFLKVQQNIKVDSKDANGNEKALWILKVLVKTVQGENCRCLLKILHTRAKEFILQKPRRVWSLFICLPINTLTCYINKKGSVWVCMFSKPGRDSVFANWQLARRKECVYVFSFLLPTHC